MDPMSPATSFRTSPIVLISCWWVDVEAASSSSGVFNRFLLDWNWPYQGLIPSFIFTRWVLSWVSIDFTNSPSRSLNLACMASFIVFSIDYCCPWRGLGPCCVFGRGPWSFWLSDFAKSPSGSLNVDCTGSLTAFLIDSEESIVSSLVFLLGRRNQSSFFIHSANNGCSGFSCTPRCVCMLPSIWADDPISSSHNAHRNSPNWRCPVPRWWETMGWRVEFQGSYRKVASLDQSTRRGERDDPCDCGKTYHSGIPFHGYFGFLSRDLQSG